MTKLYFTDHDPVLNKYSFIYNPYRPEQYDHSKKFVIVQNHQKTQKELEQINIQNLNYKYKGFGQKVVDPSIKQLVQKKTLFNKEVYQFNQNQLKGQLFLKKIQDQNSKNIFKIQLKEMALQIRLKNISKLEKIQNQSIAVTERINQNQYNQDFLNSFNNM